MKRHIRFATVLLSILYLTARSQDAPVTFAPFITNAANGNVTADITVDDFTNIGAISLRLLYNPLVLTYVSATPNAGLVTANFTVTSTNVGPGVQRLNISYPFVNPPATLADGSVLVTLTFTFTDGNEINHSLLDWSDDGSSCEYRDGSNAVLNDSPTDGFYHDGLIASQVAPVSFLPNLDFYTAGPFELPVTVTGFNEIGSISLTFEYDPAVITYVNTFSAPASLGSLTVDDHASTDGKRKIIIGWFGTPASLSNGAALVTLDFDYITGTTGLAWLDNGTSCEYGDASMYSLYDSPTPTYYKNGGILPTPAPLVKADTIKGSAGNIITVPIHVWGFENINSMDLTLDFTPSVLTYSCATLHPDLPGELTVDNSTSGRLVFSWTSASEVSLTDAATLIYLSFLYNGGSTALTWFNSGSSCEFTTGPAYTPLTDLPTSQHYHNGLVGQASGPALWTGATSTAWNTGTNWQGGQVPDSFFDVLITTSNTPPNWPLFTGDFTVGQQCRGMVMEGASQFTATGDLNIASGKILNVVNNATIKVGGDWYNEGIFKPGMGTVDFYGGLQSNIPSGAAPGNELENYSVATFAVGMASISGGTSGPTGDNAHSDVAIGFTFKFLGVNYTTVRINTNGWLSLDLSGDDATSGDNSRMFYNMAPSNVLAPWWDDLADDVASVIIYKTEGTAPNRVFMVEWKDLLSYASEATARLNFQVKLYETTNIIEYCYGTVTAGTHNALEGASVGINDGGGGGGGGYIEATTASMSNIITCLASGSNWPTVNYRFTPPASSESEVFYKVNVSKDSGVKLRIIRDTHVTGL